MIQHRIRTTKLARSRFLAYVGTAMVAGAVQAWFPNVAEASPPNGCSGYDSCPCCSGAGCCGPGCSNIYTCHGAQCWRTCAYESSALISFDCCDYDVNASSCICRQNYGSC
jgi:hypothetical protein